MAAILNALTHRTHIRGYTLYSTSFPCHICAKHILAAGISKVVYIEPYPKSRAADFYPTAICIDRDCKNASEDGTPPVPFDPFVGIGPSLYLNLFKSLEGDREADGKRAKWV